MYFNMDFKIEQSSFSSQWLTFTLMHVSYYHENYYREDDTKSSTQNKQIGQLAE